MIIDATNLVLGRIGTRAAKAALLGSKVNIINCEKATISGDRKKVLNEYIRKRDMGVPAKGPFIPRRPAMFVKRTIRGMLPYKQPKGREAFERIKCHTGNPENMVGETIEKANIKKLPYIKFVTVGEICKLIGGKQ